MGTRQDIVDTTGSKLQDILDSRQLTMSGLARMADVSHEVVRKIRDGKTVRRDKFFAILKALKMKPEEILSNWNNNNGTS